MFPVDFESPPVFGDRTRILWGYHERMRAGAIYDEPDFDNARHRYALWRIWDDAQQPLIVIGLNPSTATHEILDPTIRRDIRYARDLGFGGLVKMNLFSYRSTDPRKLYEWIRLYGTVNTDPLTGGVTHNDYLKWFTDPSRAGLVLCAWGAHGALLSRGEQVARMLTQSGVQLYALDVTKDGQPRHTLYLRADLKPQPYAFSA